MSKLVDRKEEIYGSWKIIEKVQNQEKIFTRWQAQCICGKVEELISTQITSGKARKDCGCKRSWVGKRFGKLVVLEIGKKGNHNDYALCKCDCGKQKKIWGTSLYRGCTKSCGCFNDQRGLKSGLNSVYKLYQKRAEKLKLEFSISFEIFENLCKGKCFYCNREPSNEVKRTTKTKGTRSFVYNGIDRVENVKGYTEKNVVSCCKMCNLMKKDMSTDEWFKQMKKILQYHLDVKQMNQTAL